MDLAKDAFIVLFCLAGSDGNLDERERTIIVDFLNRQSVALGQMNFAPQQAVSEIAALDLAGRGEMLNRALENLKAHSSTEVQLAMLDAAAAIAAADGSVTDGEKTLFQTMATVWAIDLQEFLQQRGVPVAAPTQDSSSEREKRASIFSWTLGGALANYSLNAPLLQPEKSAADFDKAEMSAEVLGLTVRPMPEGFDPLMIKFNSLAYLQKSLKIADDIEVRFGAAAASYFEIIVQCYLPLLLQNSASENRTFSQTALEKILTLKAYAPIPDDYFQPLVAAARQAVGVEDLKQTIFDFDRRVYEFLCARLKPQIEHPSTSVVETIAPVLENVQLQQPGENHKFTEEKQMNAVKNAFAILYFLASADGSVDERELQIIVDFTNRRQDQLNFDPRQEIMELAVFTGEARIAAYDRALFDFRDNSSIEERYTLMHFAADLAAADGAISENEKILFQDMAKVWGVDTQTLFQQSRDFVASTAAPPAEPTITVTTAGINYVNTPAAAVSPAPAAAPDKKTNRAIFFAWSLGSSFALDTIAMTHINAAQTEPHFERAQMAASGLGVTVNRLTGMTHDQISNDAKALLHLVADEGRRIAEQIDARCGGTVSAYFKMIVRCHRLLLFYNDRMEHREYNQSFLDNVLSLKPDTIIPDAFFQPLISAVRENVAWFVFKPIVYEFDRAVGEFLHERIDDEKNTVAKNVVEETHQTPDLKSAAQTAAQASPNLSEPLSEPLQTLADYSQGRADNDRVLRALVGHHGWYVPLQLFLKTGEDKSRQKKVVFISAEDRVKESEIWLFTDYASLMRAAAANAPIGSYAGAINGTELFGKIPADIKSIRVNPYSPIEQTWSFLDETSVELARLWSEVIALEEKIKRFQPGKPDLTALGNYRGFITVVNAETNGIFLIKEFNEEMRIAAPVFTAPDSADRFLANLPPEKSRALKQITISGHTLLDDLPNMKIEMPNEQPSRSFDGAVINAYGPGVFYILRFDDIRK